MNGFSTFYKVFADEKMTPKPVIDLRGFIMDSTPGRVDRELCHIAFSKAMFPKSKIMSAIADILLAPIFYVFFMAAKSRIEAMEATVQAFYDNPVKAPTLMLGSERDELVLYKHMLEYSEVARQAGTDIQTQFWCDSGHVRLYKDHQDEYTSLIQSFTRKFLCDQ